MERLKNRTGIEQDSVTSKAEKLQGRVAKLEKEVEIRNKRTQAEELYALRESESLKNPCVDTLYLDPESDRRKYHS